MRLNPLGAVVVLAALTLAPSDCSATSSGTRTPVTSPSASAPTSPEAVTRISTTATSCPDVGNLEGAFTTSSQMDDYLACIVPRVEEWIDVVLPNAPHPQGYYFVPLGVKDTDQGCRYDDATLAYCPATENIYFGERATWTQYTKHGDASAALIMAHEVTHHFQRLAKMPPAQVRHDQIRYEDQADCGGGTFIQYATRQGWLHLKDDVIDLAGTLAAAGSIPGPDRDHGSTPERLAAFGRGVIGGPPNPLRSCNRYVPEVPLVP